MKIFIQPYRIADFFLKHKKENCSFFITVVVLYYIVFVFIGG